MREKTCSALLGGWASWPCWALPGEGSQTSSPAILEEVGVSCLTWLC